MKKLRAMPAIVALAVVVGGMHSAQAADAVGILAGVIQLGGATVVGGGEPDGWEPTAILETPNWHTNEDAGLTSTAVIEASCADDGTATVSVSGVGVSGGFGGGSLSFTITGLISTGDADSDAYAGVGGATGLPGTWTFTAAGSCNSSIGAFVGVAS
jgi:hypothetical protein